MQIRLAILVEGQTSSLAKKLAKKLSLMSDSYFWVDGKKLAHHITLFDILPTTKQLPKAGYNLNEFLANRKSFSLSLNGLWKSHKDTGYIGLAVKKQRSLVNLRSQMFKNLESYKPQRLNNNYRPHITLTRYKDFNFPAEIKNVKLKNEFNAQTVILAKVDKHGQIYKILKRIELK